MNVLTLYLALAIGAAYGTSKSGIGIAGLGTFRPELIMKVRHLSNEVASATDPVYVRPVVTHSRGNVRNHRSVWIGGLGLDCWAA